MKKSGIINGQLAGVVGALGHFDKLVISDAGLPLPKGVEVIDLAIIGGLPSFMEVLNAVLLELEVEEYTVASEMKDQPHDILQQIKGSLPHAKMHELPQNEFNEVVKTAKAIVRTAEFSHYTNVILTCGCAF